METHMYYNLLTKQVIEATPIGKGSKFKYRVKTAERKILSLEKAIWVQLKNQPDTTEILNLLAKFDREINAHITAYAEKFKQTQDEIIKKLAVIE